MKHGFNLAKPSIVEPNLGPSSVSKTLGSPFLCGTITGTISSLNFPSLIAFSAFKWELSENSSNSSLVNPHSFTIFSAVTPIW